jgi:hypothetical protein
MEDLSLEVEDQGGEEVVKAAAPRTRFTAAMEQTGALDFLTDVLLNLYANPKPIPELYNFFLAATGTGEAVDVEKLLLENQELRKTIIVLKQQISELEARTRK